jgi:hypothetical protein
MPDRVVFPGGDASLKEARNVVITATPELMEADPAYAANPNVNKFARKQKAWLCSNFRLRLGDLPCSRVTQFDPLVIELRQVGDLDSDGSPDMAVHVSDVAFEIPYEDSPLFMEEFKKSQSGSPSSLPLVVDYLDDDGFLLISVAMTVQIRSVGPNDIFTDPAATKKPPVKVSTHSGESKPLQIKVTY